jgi:hypothetical protein
MVISPLSYLFFFLIPSFSFIFHPLTRNDRKRLSFDIHILNFLGELTVHIIIKDQPLADVHLVK